MNSIVMEAISTSNLWIWHSFIGIPGSNNDINIVDRSLLIIKLLNRVAPNIGFIVNDHDYRRFYLLTDGIYPNYNIFMKTISNPQDAKRKCFAQKQEGTRKDVERCFRILQA